MLFIFPSRYLFAIGLSPIFSFRWNLPPILSCIPKQLDSLKVYHRALVVHVKDGILTLYDALFQGTCTWASTENTSIDYNSDDLRPPDFKFELFPLRSPLLGESLLVSFPPLIDMLKFSGYPYLIRGQPWGVRGAGPQRPGGVTKARCSTTQGRQLRKPPIDLGGGSLAALDPQHQ